MIDRAAGPELVREFAADDGAYLGLNGLRRAIGGVLINLGVAALGRVHGNVAVEVHRGASRGHEGATTASTTNDTTSGETQRMPLINGLLQRQVLLRLGRVDDEFTVADHRRDRVRGAGARSANMPTVCEQARGRHAAAAEAEDAAKDATTAAEQAGERALSQKRGLNSGLNEGVGKALHGVGSGHAPGDDP